MNSAIVCVGSNVDAENSIKAATELLEKEQVLVASSVFVRTTPVGLSDQPDFTNGALKIETELDITELRAYLKSLEARLGRVRGGDKNGPRVIDLDLVVFGGAIVDDDFEKYDFVREAVIELQPDLA
ncbi:MAG: 2-amino-4-hydroxy-6-hydroxymethyldihydropteridine diphosphokinase [Thermodesulfobacteriota bacterium]